MRQAPNNNNTHQKQQWLVLLLGLVVGTGRSVWSFNCYYHVPKTCSSRRGKQFFSPSSYSSFTSRELSSSAHFVSAAEETTQTTITSTEHGCGKTRRKTSFRQRESSNAISKRLSRQIWACGSDSEKAVGILVKAYPFLKRDDGLEVCSEDDDVHHEQLCLDGKSISTAIKVLGKAKRFEDAFFLLERVSELFAILRKRTNDKQGDDNNVSNNAKKLEADVRMCYNACISAAGICGEWETGRHLLYRHMYQWNQLSPNVDSYHSLITACRKCGAVDAVLDIVTDMEAGKILSLESSVDDSSEMVQIVPPKPDRM
eukprot:9344829-Ditylum_brightwellii.AAC.1